MNESMLVASFSDVQNKEEKNKSDEIVNGILQKEQLDELYNFILSKFSPNETIDKDIFINVTGLNKITYQDLM